MSQAGCAGGSGVLVLDSGGGYIRAGPATHKGPAVVEPNCSALPKGKAGRGLAFGSEVLELPSYTLCRPTRRGLVLDPEQQRTIWDCVLRRRLSIDPREWAVLATEAPLTPASWRRETEEILLETFGFQEVCVLPAPELALHSPGLRSKLDPYNPCCTVLSLGYSSSIALPCIENQVVDHAVRRLNVGGRVLTNLMVERLKLRHYDLTSSWLLAEDVLRKVGEVSRDFDTDLRSGFGRVEPRTYLLPDFKTRHRGLLVDAEQRSSIEGATEGGHHPSGAAGNMQRMTLAAERVVVPEALFRPGDHGIRQAGVTELVHEAILAAGAGPWQPHLGQVAVCGGLARLPNLCERLKRELRELLPASWPVQVVTEAEPELSVWRGAAHLAMEPGFREGHFLSRQSLDEVGNSGARKRKVDR